MGCGSSASGESQPSFYDKKFGVLYDIKAPKLVNGEETSFDDFKGKLCFMINVASA